MRILGIHGIGQTFLGAEELKQRWLPALQSGLSEAKAEPLQPSDFDMVGYGALFRPEGNRRSGPPRIEPEDLTEWERDLLAAWWREAVRVSATGSSDAGAEAGTIQGPDFEGRVRTPQFAQRALRQLSKSRFFAALGPQRVLLFGLRQVRLFLHDAAMKQAILARVVEKMTADTGVIIAHSLGTVVAYEALCAHPQWPVHTLITLGSPLGIAHLVFNVLTPRPQDGRGIWPPGLRRWVNLADTGDIVALVKKLAPLFGPVKDDLVYNGWHSHDAAIYLSARRTGQAVAEGLACSGGP